MPGTFKINYQYFKNNLNNLKNFILGEGEVGPKTSSKSFSSTNQELRALEQRIPEPKVKTCPSKEELASLQEAMDNFFTKDRSFKIKNDPSVHQFLKKVGVSDQVLQQGTFTLGDISDPTYRRYTKALMFVFSDKTKNLSEQAKDTEIRFNEFNEKHAEAGNRILSLYPLKVEELFSNPQGVAGSQINSAMILENYLESQNLIPYRRNLQAHTGKPDDFAAECFRGKEIRGIEFHVQNLSNSASPAGAGSVQAVQAPLTTVYQTAARSVIKFTSTPGDNSGRYFPSSAVIVKGNSQDPGGIQIYTALHCIDPEFQNKDLKNVTHSMEVEINGRTYDIDASSLSYDYNKGDFACLKLRRIPNMPDLSPYAANLATEKPKNGAEVFAIGYPFNLSTQTREPQTLTFGSLFSSHQPKGASMTALYQAEILVRPGYSGGGFFNSKGELLGISSSYPKDNKQKVECEWGRFYPISLPQAQK